MKILKTILIVVLIIIALPFVIAIFIPGDYAVQREVVINKPKAEVFDYIKHIKNQDTYSTWNMADPAKKTTFTGTDGTEGFIYTWNGNDKVGEGAQEITKITEGERIDMDLRFKRPFESEAHTFMSTEETERGTKVTWGMNGHNEYPKNIMNLFMDTMMGDALSQNLTNLKNNLEK
jgi:uncharacterized protein YndB with AHSA1/START domain